MFLDLKPEQWLGLTVLAAVISVIGTLIGIVFKDFIFARAFENWKQRKALDQLYQKFRDPLLLSVKDLSNRMIEILDDYPTGYLKNNVADIQADQLHPEKLIDNSINDPYFQRYKLVSTIYRFCAFLGWLELVRQEIVFLNSGNNKHWRRLENTLNKIRSALADGQLNDSGNWLDWKDYLIFREEIRAIGECMICFEKNVRTVIGYSKFCELFDNNDSTNPKRWISVVMNFMLDFKDSLDFRKCRITLLTIYLIDLVELLDNNKLEKRFSDARINYNSVLTGYPLPK